MNKSRLCGICGKPFIPNKHHPDQIYCSFAKCQKERRRRYMAGYNKVWRERHREYWKKYWKQKKMYK